MVCEAMQAGQQQPVHVAERARPGIFMATLRSQRRPNRRCVGEHKGIRHPPVQVEGMHDPLFVDATEVALTGRQLHDMFNRRFVAKRQEQELCTIAARFVHEQVGIVTWAQHRPACTSCRPTRRPSGRSAGIPRSANAAKEAGQFATLELLENALRLRERRSCRAAILGLPSTGLVLRDSPCQKEVDRMRAPPAPTIRAGRHRRTRRMPHRPPEPDRAPRNHSIGRTFRRIALFRWNAPGEICSAMGLVFQMPRSRIVEALENQPARVTLYFHHDG